MTLSLTFTTALSRVLVLWVVLKYSDNSILLMRVVLGWSLIRPTVAGELQLFISSDRHESF